MMVMDASAMVQALVGRDAAPELFDALEDEVAVPHLLDIEVLSALRGMTLGRVIHPAQGDAARAAYAGLRLHRYDAAPLADRIWQLRHQFTSYDACYIALAEGLDAPLITCDRRLATSGHRAVVRVCAAPA